MLLIIDFDCMVSSGKKINISGDVFINPCFIIWTKNANKNDIMMSVCTLILAWEEAQISTLFSGEQASGPTAKPKIFATCLNPKPC